MNQRILLPTILALGTGLVFSCSAMRNDVAKTNGNGRVAENTTPIFGQPGVDFPAPFYIGERNSDLRHARPSMDEINQRSAAAELGEEYDPALEEEEFEVSDREYTIGNGNTDWNKERVYGTVPGDRGDDAQTRERMAERDRPSRPVARDQVRSRQAAPRVSPSVEANDKTMNKEPVGEMYGTAVPFPADQSVNVANLADADLISRFHLSNVRQIELGRLAQERGNSEWVRSLGRRIAMDNQYADRRLMNLTRRLELSVPANGVGVDSAASFDHLETASLDNLTGADFDRELVTRIKSAQEEKLQMLRGAEQNMAKDSSLRELVLKFIPITEQHGEVAQSVSTKYLEQNI